MYANELFQPGNRMLQMFILIGRPNDVCIDLFASHDNPKRKAQ